jgi:hypothetical protein
MRKYFDDDAYIPSSVHHWVHKFKTGRVSIEDKPRSRNPPLDDADADADADPDPDPAILKRLLETPFSSLRTLSEYMHIPNIMVWEHMAKFVNLQCCHFK